MMEKRTEDYGLRIGDTNYMVIFTQAKENHFYENVGYREITKTQAIITDGDFVVGLGEVIRHWKDDEDFEAAKVFSLKKAMHKLNNEFKARLFNYIFPHKCFYMVEENVALLTTILNPNDDHTVYIVPCAYSDVRLYSVTVVDAYRTPTAEIMTHKEIEKRFNITLS